MSSIKLFSIICAIVFTCLTFYLGSLDAIQADKALDAQIRLRKFCDENKRVPTHTEYLKVFPKLSKQKESREARVKILLLNQQKYQMIKKF